MGYNYATQNNDRKFSSIADKQEMPFAVAGKAPTINCFKESMANKAIRLPVAVGLFGANASGKSAVLRGVVSVFKFITNSEHWLDDNISNVFQPYRHEQYMDKPTKIVIEFDCKLSADSMPALFRYELHVENKIGEFADKVVLYEALSYSPNGRFRSLFERNLQNIHFGKDFAIKNNDQRKNYLRKDAGVIGTLARAGHKISIHILSLIANLQTNIIGYGEPYNASQDDIITSYSKNHFAFEALNHELRRIDVGIEKVSLENSVLYFYHKNLSSYLLLIEESNGTKKFIEIFWAIYHTLNCGGVAIIDELDSYLHPKLLAEIVSWFSSSEQNPHNAQLFFTAHNADILNELEKEQVFFTTKKLGKSYVYGARNIAGLKRGQSLVQKYLFGELGAIPRIG